MRMTVILIFFMMRHSYQLLELAITLEMNRSYISRLSEDREDSVKKFALSGMSNALNSSLYSSVR